MLNRSPKPLQHKAPLLQKLQSDLRRVFAGQGEVSEQGPIEEQAIGKRLQPNMEVRQRLQGFEGRPPGCVTISAPGPTSTWLIPDTILTDDEEAGRNTLDAIATPARHRPAWSVGDVGRLATGRSTRFAKAARPPRQQWGECLGLHWDWGWRSTSTVAFELHTAKPLRRRLVGLGGCCCREWTQLPALLRGRGTRRMGAKQPPHNHHQSTQATAPCRRRP